MSFYGNIANGGKTNLTFDKVYPNRMQMDLRAQVDDVFVGRFVLVEYDDNTFAYREGFMSETSIPTDTTQSYYIYTDRTFRIPYKVVEHKVDEGYGVQVEGLYPGDIVSVSFSGQRAFFVCKDQEANGTALFTLIQLGTDNANKYDYSNNYNIDKKEYQGQFVDGWDSTIWQKVVQNGEFKYIMVGDLNSKVPRFNIQSEPPTIEPIAPHFGENSTNMDYTLHVQPNWGFRVKKATEKKNGDVILSDTDISDIYKAYDPITDTITEEQGYKGAIYYNKDGFDKYNRNVDGADVVVDKIVLEPTGTSGQKYYSHNPAEIQTVKEDIQELTIHLPIIGNSVAEFWDIMYGDKDENDEFLEVRNTDIDWESVPEPKREGVRLVKEDPQLGGFDYLPKKVETVAGCINSVHDLMGMIVLNGETSLADADTDHIYYGKLSGSSRNGYYMKTRKNTYTPLAHEDLEGYVNSKKYMDLTQYQKHEYHTKTNNSFYEELNDKPTPNANYYKIEAEKIDLKVWVADTTPDIPGNEEDEDHYWKDAEGNYIKDYNKDPDASRDYYTIISTTQTTPNSKGAKVEIYAPKPSREYIDTEGDTCYEGYLYFMITGYDEETGNPIYSEKVYELMPRKRDADGDPIYDAEGNPEFEEAGPLLENAIYFFVDKYKIDYITPVGGGDPVLGIVDAYNKAFNNDNMPAPEKEIIFLDFNEEGVTYYSFGEITINDVKEQGYIRLQKIEDYDKTLVYYTLKATAETGNLPASPGVSGGEGPEGEEELIFTHYYVPNKYYYKQGNNDYIFGTEEDRVIGVDYYILSGHETPVDVTFYEPTKYYYEKEVTKTIEGKPVVEIVQILDNDTTMKTKDTELDENEKILSNAEGLVYYLQQEAYVVNDPTGILSAGTIWNSGSVIPESLELGKLYQGEDVDRDGNEVPEGTISKDEKAERMFEWKELTGFARTLNTIHGLILKVNQYFKFDDTLTRDRTTIQGCLNNINDIINDFAALIPGEIAVIDEYGRIKSATLFTTAADNTQEEGWISVVVDPNAVETKITIRHNDPKEADTILGQKSAKTLKFGDTFQALQFGIDEKGHIHSKDFKEFTMTMPSLKVTDNDTKQIVTGFSVGGEGQDLVITRENVGNFALTGYTYPNTAIDIDPTDTVNIAFGKMQRLLNNEIENRVAAINALDMAENASTTQFITSISQTDGKINVSRADAGTLVLGSGYSIAAQPADISSDDSLNTAFGKVEAKFKLLGGDSSEPGSIAYTIAEMAINADDNTSIDKLNEIAAWIVNDQTGVAKMNADIAKNASDIAALQTASGETGTNVSGLTTRIDDLEAIVTEDAVNTWVNIQSDWTEADEASTAFIKNKPDLENLVKTTTEFNYTYNEVTTPLTIDGLLSYIAKLEERIYNLENPPESDEPENPDTPEVPTE